MKLYTIGFTQKSAEAFFGLLRATRIERLVDIRLRPSGQLAGFAKQEDLPYFLRELSNELPVYSFTPPGPDQGNPGRLPERSRLAAYVERFEIPDG